MAYSFRPARPEDLPAIHGVFLDALNDLNTRNGLPRVATPAADRAAIRRYVMTGDPGGFWVALRGGDEIVGWAASIRRGRIWFLSGFWVHPSAQNARIGSTLLRHSMETAPGPGEDGVISVYASRDSRALALYQRHGMYARFPLFTYGGDPGPRLDRASGERLLQGAGLAVEQVAPGVPFTPPQAAHIAALDTIVRGPASDRPADHSFFRNNGNFTTYLFTREGQPAAYANLSTWGSLAPLAAADEEIQRPVLHYLLSEAARRGVVQVNMDVPGINRVVIEILLQRRFRLLGYNFFLCSEPFGRMEQYAASGAVLF